MLLIVPALILGLSGSLHCIGMCGPLMMRLPFVNSKNTFLSLTLYHGGKTLTYALAGVLFGLMGQGFTLIRWQQGLSIIAGLALLLITFFPVIRHHFSMGNRVAMLFQQLQNRLLGKNEALYFLLSGVVNGMLPCGLVYAALAGAAVSGTALQGAAFMTAFGVGTIPSLTLLTLFGHKLKLSKQRIFTRTTFYISIFVGVLLIFRGLNLGIRYISPSFDPVKKEMSCCHKAK